MTIYLDQSDREATEEDVATVQNALQYGQRDGWEGVMKRLRTVYPSVDYYAGSTHIRILLDGDGRGKSVYVDTLVRVQDTQPEV